MRVFLVAFCVLAAMVGVRGQAPADKITPEEYIEANELAHRFSRSLLERRNLEPLLRKYFADDFVARKKADSDRDLFLSKELAAGLSIPEYRRYFVTLNNWLYLYSLVYFSEYSSTKDPPTRDPFIESVKNIFGNDRKFLLEMDGAASVINTKKELNNFIRLLNRALALARRSAKAANAGHTREWQETMADFESRFSYFKPWLITGEPKGTRKILVNAQIFQLTLLKIEGKLRVVHASYYIH